MRVPNAILRYNKVSFEQTAPCFTHNLSVIRFTGLISHSPTSILAPYVHDAIRRTAAFVAALLSTQSTVAELCTNDDRALL